MTYATAGAGHRRAAEAIAQAATALLPGAEVECHDLLAHVPPPLRQSYPWMYYLLVRHLPFLWGACFEGLDAAGLYRLIQPIRRAWNLVMARVFVRWVKALSPEVVIATHFLPADVVGSLKRAGSLQTRLVVVVTDLHPHRFWLAPEADAFIVATPETAAECERRGVPRARLHVLGIPIAAGFHLPVDRESLRSRFGLEVGRKTVLATSGGSTVGPFERVVEDLMGLEDTHPGQVQLLVVCGENLRAAQRLQSRARSCALPVHVFGFVDNMAELMGLADLVVAKAGGVTVSESLARGLPLVLYHAIPGQERFNAQYMSRHGAAVIAYRRGEVTDAVQRFLTHPEFAQQLRTAALALSRPLAAEAIVSQVVPAFLNG